MCIPKVVDLNMFAVRMWQLEADIDTEKQETANVKVLMLSLEYCRPYAPVCCGCNELTHAQWELWAINCRWRPVIKGFLNITPVYIFVISCL